MKKVGILTLFYKTYNFGAQLQAFALQKAVESLGFACEQIRFAWSREETRLYYECASVSQDAFEEFAGNISHSREIYTPENLWEAEKEYDSFLCGSDQIWGVKGSMPEDVLPLMTLSFVGKNKKKIAYGASFGSAAMEENRKEILKPFLNRLDFISMREKSAVPLVEKMSGKKAVSVVDPVLLLSAEEWRKAAASGDSCRPGEDYIFFYSVSGRESLYKRALHFAESKKLPLIYIAYTNGERIGPRDFISMIDHAAYVITDSFHGTAFSIIFRKPFITVGIDSLPTDYSRSIRILDMLESVGLEDCFFSREEDAWEERFAKPYSMAQVEEKIRRMAEDSMEYLRHALCGEEDTAKKTKAFGPLWDSVVNQEKCTGCGSCARCAADAIQMEPDRLGFYRPALNMEACTGCGECLELCPVYSKRNLEVRPALSVFALWAKEKEILKKSASGGAFFVIAKKWIDDGGVVCGAVYDAEKNFTVKHICAETLEELLAMQKSKYVQSDLGQCFFEIEQYLKAGRQVLFSGTPCQAAGLRACLQKDYAGLYVLDLVCGGVTAPLLWKKYVEHYQKNGKVDAFDMRAKSKGFFDDGGRLAFAMAHFRDGEESVFEKDRDWFLRPRMSFYGECCYRCEFKGGCHDADLTLGDFVGFPAVFPQIKNNEGVSLVIVRSEKGKELLDSCSSLCEAYPASYETAASWNGMLEERIKKPLGTDYLRGIALTSSIERIYYDGERIRLFWEKERVLKDFSLELKRNDLLLRLKKYAGFQCRLESDPLIEGEVVIYGAGKLGQAMLDCMEGEPLCFIDRAKTGGSVCGYPVYQPGQEKLCRILLNRETTVIVTPVWDYWEIKERLEEAYPGIHTISLEKLMERIGI